MSQQLANHLKSYGRDGDTELVHMTKGEIKGLQELAMAHGGTLTINPDTGLAEAGFLKNILPAIAGAGLMMIPGMQGIGAGYIGLGVGALEAARTGDIGRGLMAGLGAYGGAGLAGGLMGAGAGAVTPTATSGLSTAGGTGSQAAGLSSGNLGAASSNIGLNAGSAGTGGAAGLTGSGTSLYTPNLAATPGMAGSQIAKYGMAATAPVLGDALTPPAVNPITPEKSSGRYISKDFQAYVPDQPDPYYRPRGLGYAAQGGMMPNDLSYAEGGGIKKKEEAALPQPKSELMQNMFKGLSGQPGLKAYQVTDPISQALPYMMGAKMRSIMGEELQDKMAGMFGPSAAPISATVGNVPAGYIMDRVTGQLVPASIYTPQGLGYEGYAEGGMIDPMQRMPNGGLAALQGMRDGYGAPQTMDGNIPQMADGGSIGGYSDGGRMLRGPGDGMSDSIPGVIGNKQPARLADGEFVVPADVVSHLGNGSTDAGAKRLYGMMDKVRKARTGTKKQGKQIKPEKYMPA
jgi:hypothetical protein